MPRIAIIGCGVVGATVAYEFSNLPDWEVVVIDRQQQPAQGATGAALGLLMGVISQKTKGQAWQRREYGIRYYHHLVPTLAAMGLPIAHNSQGMVKLLAVADDLAKWSALAQTRAEQGWLLEIWERDRMIDRLPQLRPSSCHAAIYSPADWQIHPPQLTQALVAAAQHQGAQFQWGREVLAMHSGQILTSHGHLDADWVVIAAGLGSMDITKSLNSTIELIPVLGQAIQYQLPSNLGNANFQPTITGDDVHIVPLDHGGYWVGATVEFPVGTTIQPAPEQLVTLQKKAIDYCPALAHATIVHTWSGLRPRPVGRPAPVIEHLPGQERVLIATGHYRNGLLLAPATANLVQEIVGIKKVSQQ